MGKEPVISNIPTETKSVAKRTGARKKTTSQYRSCLQTFISFTTISQGGTSLIPLHEGIYGSEGMTTIGKEDLEEVFGHLTLGMAVINTYIRYTPINFV